MGYFGPILAIYCDIFTFLHCFLYIFYINYKSSVVVYIFTVNMKKNNVISKKDVNSKISTTQHNF